MFKIFFKKSERGEWEKERSSKVVNKYNICIPSIYGMLIERVASESQTRVMEEEKEDRENTQEF